MSVETSSPEEEGRHHNYTSSVIPWYVRLMWLLFWLFVAWYSVRFLWPAIQAELLKPS
jgi:hypothetical protein